MFRAVFLQQTDSGTAAEVRELEERDLPDGDVMVAVDYSTINYKDGLAITGRFPVVRSWPMVPGIDLAGTVEASGNPRFKPGDKVLINGYGLGDTHWGGLAQKARVRSEWLIPVPEKFSTLNAMAIGTAGYTAMLCVLALERHGVTPDQGEVVVTGAAGGVGSVAVAVLARLGYRVAAVTGRPTEADYLTGLGASVIVDRAELSAPGKPLARERWAGGVDAVGGVVLANVLAATRYRGTVAACGLAGGMDLPATVAPFILRGVTLAGVESVMCPVADRLEAWARLARDLDPAKLEAMAVEVALPEVIATAPKFLKGEIRGRVIVPVNPSLG